MQETICAKTDARLLSKADRLFTGSVNGRIIEILQNARRAGATEVRISNKDGFVTIADNGSGIDDFQKLLDLGGSGWDEKLEAGEDPAGVGLFSLAPKEVEIVSGKKKVVIDKGGWTGTSVVVTPMAKAVNGTILKFRDERPWGIKLVEKHAVFSGIKVIVDGKKCHSMPFCSEKAVNHTSPGCRIEVVKEISKYHQQWMSYYYQNKVLVNFHGQVVEMDYFPGESRQGLKILVDINGRTDIRLMLPARTRLVENIAFERLKRMVEAEYYRYFQRQKTHTLYHKQWQRARQLGIVLPEAEPKYNTGLLYDEHEMAVEMTAPKDFKLSDGYLCIDKEMGDEYNRANVHLLAALGTFKEKTFVPVSIQSGYMGYSWAKLPTITSVKVSTGQERLRETISGTDLVCVESLSIEVKTSDGRGFVSNVSMAVANEPPKGKCRWHTEAVYVTETARCELNDEHIWYHLGGYNIDGDSYDTQRYDFEKELNSFWSDLVGPHEHLRCELIEHINQDYRISGKWQKAVIEENGTLRIIYKDGKTEIVKPPSSLYEVKSEPGGRKQ